MIRFEILGWRVAMNYETNVHLEHNNPNPFRPGAVITYSLPEKELINLSVYSMAGQLVSSLIDGQQDPGSYSVFFNAENLPAGKYIYILRAGDRYHTNVMTVQ